MKFLLMSYLFSFMNCQKFTQNNKNTLKTQYSCLMISTVPTRVTIKYHSFTLKLKYAIKKNLHRLVIQPYNSINIKKMFQSLKNKQITLNYVNYYTKTITRCQNRFEFAHTKYFKSILLTFLRSFRIYEIITIILSSIAKN